MRSEPAWKLILESAEQLTRAGRSPFTMDALIRHVQTIDPTRQRSSLSPIIQGMTVNAPGGPAAACGEVLRRVDRGLYELSGDSKHRLGPEPEPVASPAQIDDPISHLGTLHVQHQAGGEVADMIAAREGVLERYGRVFNPSNLADLSAEEFIGFLYYENNHHWWGIHRHQSVITSDMPKLRAALRLLLDEERPIEQRLDTLVRDTGANLVRGLGKAVLTPILLVVYPDRYGVWNSIAESAMKRLDLWPSLDRGLSFGRRYARVNEVMNHTAAEVGVDLWTLDGLWWAVEQEVAGAPGGVALEALTEDLPEEVRAMSPALAPTFTLERHLHDFLRDNWDRTELGSEWTLHTEGGDVVGYEYPTQVGRIDLLAHHRHEPRWLVVELKRAQSSDQTIGQVARYVGWVRQNLAAEDEKVEGLVIAGAADERLRYALDVVPDITLQTYEVDFRLRSLDA